jgi:transcriptional regulator with XRE-family HTH domain
MPDTLTALFGRLIRRHREAAGLSQEELGARTNLSRNYIGMVERGETNPTLLVLQVLAAALGTTMTELISELERVAKPVPSKRKSKQ